MQDIIKIETSSISGTAVQTVNVRELHAFLAVGKDFSTWVKLRISQYEFVENQDYVVADPAPQIWGAGNRGVKTEYHVSRHANSLAGCCGRFGRGCLRRYTN